MTPYRGQIMLILLTLLGGACSPAASGTGDRTVFQGPLPHLEGDSLRTVLLDVTYAPGDSSLPHRHPCPVVGYVTQGALRLQLEGGAERVVHAGESFYEAPMRAHLISANASRTEPVRFLASFTCDRGGELSIRNDSALGTRTGK